MNLSDKLIREIIRRWDKCRTASDRIKLAKRLGYEPERLERFVEKIKSRK